MTGLDLAFRILIGYALLMLGAVLGLIGWGIVTAIIAEGWATVITVGCGIAAGLVVVGGACWLIGGLTQRWWDFR